LEPVAENAGFPAGSRERASIFSAFHHQSKMARNCIGLEILELGEGTRSPVKTARLRTEWTRWAREAGFAKFGG
jgi:hypothetical protein